MNKLLFYWIVLFPLAGLAQFNFINEFGAGLNLPILNPLHNASPVPALQLDYWHEFYSKTHYVHVEKSIETRIGLTFTDLSSNSLYMFNVGIQDSYRRDNYLLAFGADLVGFISQSSKISGEFIGMKKGGTFGQGDGLGIFYKFGRRLNDSWSITAELGGLVYLGNFYTYTGGPIVWRINTAPSIGLYRGNISLDYHF